MFEFHCEGYATISPGYLIITSLYELFYLISKNDFNLFRKIIKLMCDGKPYFASSVKYSRRISKIKGLK